MNVHLCHDGQIDMAAAAIAMSMRQEIKCDNLCCLLLLFLVCRLLRIL